MVLHNQETSTSNFVRVSDYKDIDVLRKFINDQGKILSRKSTKLNAKQQKKLTKAIKQARIISLLPFLNRN